MSVKDHITVCICSYKRPQMLAQLLTNLAEQDTQNLFTYSILIIDNDSEGSAQAVVRKYQERAPIQVDYYIESVKGIPVARNRAINESGGSLLAFIDDDEFPSREWLLRLFTSIGQFGAAGVLGPVKPYFVIPPPPWILKSKLFERPALKTGTILNWPDTRTGNVLLQRYLFKDKESFFNIRIGHGEDKDFFRRMITKGHSFVWCDEALVYEVEPAERFKRGYFLKRALVRGSYYFPRATCKPLQIFKSILALASYSLTLPVFSFCGQHLLMKSLIGICDNAGCLIGACGIKPEKYFKHS